LVTYLRASLLTVIIRYVPLLREQFLLTWSHTEERAVPWVVGAALAIRRDAFEAVGGFDESFFMYSEEVDLCYRLSLAGWPTYFTPKATIVHRGGASTVQVRADMAVGLYMSTRQFYQRHYSRWQALQLRLVDSYNMLWNISRDIVRLLGTRRAESKLRLADDIAIWARILFANSSGTQQR
jgi:GT2 family glycosyltransferase